ncbi:hypothetical protein QR680_009811 [Steinernema hermaphroditum]|uniref:Saposin B-type domain-containing protein n=1 Tax=Steinernema hermaphroditum TaxID=289476 RepID=A0AA39MAK6_9BILA|nr:hypothetical protein QR680_009811 [Steinernema hermaphroditum]
MILKSALLLVLCLASSSALDGLVTTCSLCRIAKEVATSAHLPMESVRAMIKTQCLKSPEGQRRFCEGVSEEFVLEQLAVVGAFLRCEDYCGTMEMELDKDFMCQKIREISFNKAIFDTMYFSTTKRFCSKETNAVKCHLDSAAAHPVLKDLFENAMQSVTKAVDCSIQAPNTFLADMLGSAPPMKCVLCKYLLNWIGECFVHENKTSRDMQKSIRDIVKKVCDLNKICPLLHCSCDKIADKAIDIIKRMDVSQAACVKYDSACAGM